MQLKNGRNRRFSAILHASYQYFLRMLKNMQMLHKFVASLKFTNQNKSEESSILYFFYSHSEEVWFQQSLVLHGFTVSDILFSQH